MRHLNKKVRLSRNTAHRIAMMRNMVTSLIECERIQTTLPKAKQLRSLADQMVTLGKQGTLHARRRALATVRKKSAVSKLFTELATRFKDRAGGYTRVLKLGFRHGDGAPMALVEYLGFTPKVASSAAESGAKPKKAPAAKAKKATKKTEDKPKREKKVSSKAAPSAQKKKAKSKTP